MALTITPKPSVPPEAIESEGAAEFAFKNAKSSADYAASARHYEKALLTAPWVAADYFNNGSVFGGVRPALSPPSLPPTPPLETKIYVTFTMSDGDNIQYDQRRMRILWDNPARFYGLNKTG